MGVDRYQITKTNWKYIQGVDGRAVTNLGVSKGVPSNLVLNTRNNLSKDFYRNSWFRALNDIQNSEKFMCYLDNIYWEVKNMLQSAEAIRKPEIPLNTKQAVYTLNLGPSVSDKYFIEIKFNFYNDEITFGIGENI